MPEIMECIHVAIHHMNRDPNPAQNPKTLDKKRQKWHSCFRDPDGDGIQIVFEKDTGRPCITNTLYLEVLLEFGDSVLWRDDHMAVSVHVDGGHNLKKVGEGRKV